MSDNILLCQIQRQKSLKNQDRQGILTREGILNIMSNC